MEKIFAEERDRYLKFFIQQRDYLISKEPRTATELLISANADTIPYPYRYIRVDAMSKTTDDKNKGYLFAGAVTDGNEKLYFDLSTFRIEINPFSWDSIQLLWNCTLHDVGAFENLITRWLDIKDEFPKKALGLSQAIHSFSPIESKEGWSYATGDFGTAPVEALLEFIHLLSQQGATRIVVRRGRTGS